MHQPFLLLRLLAEAVLPFPPGCFFGDALAQLVKDLWQSWCRERTDDQRKEELRGIARLFIQQLQHVVDDVVLTVAADRAPEAQRSVANYLMQFILQLQQLPLALAEGGSLEKTVLHIRSVRTGVKVG